MPKKKKSCGKENCTESLFDKEVKESYLENIQRLVATNKNLNADTLTAIESFCNFDPKKTYETLLQLFHEEDGNDENLSKLDSTCTKTGPWTEASIVNKLKVRLLKEKYSFASEDWIMDVLCFFEGSMEQTETFLLESYPIDDPNVIMDKMDKPARENKSLHNVALYLRDLDALRISSEQQRNALGGKRSCHVAESTLDKSRYFWNQYLLLGRLASITRKKCYSQQAKEMKQLFEHYSNQALDELTKCDSFAWSPFLDLHGFFVEEALLLLESKISLMKQATTRRPLIIHCITGKGNGSISGSRLRPAVERYCKEQNLVYKLEEGAVIVYVGL